MLAMTVKHIDRGASASQDVRVCGPPVVFGRPRWMPAEPKPERDFGLNSAAGKTAGPRGRQSFFVQGSAELEQRRGASSTLLTCGGGRRAGTESQEGTSSMKSAVFRATLMGQMIFAGLVLSSLPAGAQSRETANGGTTRVAQSSPQVAPEASPGSTADALADCAQRYYAALQDIRGGTAKKLSPALKQVRRLDRDLPGRWLFTETLIRGRGADNRLIDGDRVCVNEVRKGGRGRCLEWGPLQPARPPAEPVFAVPPLSSDERRLSASILMFVRTRGALPEWFGEGRYGWVAQRVATDLTAYLRQPPNPALCSGANEMLSFFVSNMGALRKRILEVAELDRSARTLAWAKVRAVHGDAAGPLPASTAAPTVAEAPPDYTSMISQMAEILLSAEQARAVRAAPTALQALKRTAEALHDPIATSAVSIVEANARAALRSLEAGVHAELMHARHQAVSDSLFGTIDSIRQVHSTTCTCGG